MGLFRRKKEKTYNRTTTIIIEISVALVLFLAAIGIKWLVTNHDKKIGKINFDDQVVENLSFMDFELKTNTKEFMVNVRNYTEEKEDVKELVINFYAEDNSLVSSIVVPGFTLEKNQGTEVKGNVGTEVKLSKVEYIIKK